MHPGRWNNKHHGRHLYKAALAEKSESKNIVDSRDHDLHFLYNEVMASGSTESMEALEKEIQHRKFIDSLFGQFEDIPNALDTPQDFDCLRMMVGGVEDMCGDWSAYSLKYVRKLSNACDNKTIDEVSQMYAQIGNFCGAF